MALRSAGSWPWAPAPQEGRPTANIPPHAEPNPSTCFSFSTSSHRQVDNALMTWKKKKTSIAPNFLVTLFNCIWYPCFNITFLCTELRFFGLWPSFKYFWAPLFLSFHLLLGATGVAQPGAVVSLLSSNSSVLVQIKLKAKRHGRGWQRQPEVIAGHIDRAKLCQKAKICIYKMYHLFPSSK